MEKTTRHWSRSVGLVVAIAGLIISGNRFQPARGQVISLGGADDQRLYLPLVTKPRPTLVMVLVSVASDGTQGNNESYLASLSADGRYATFESWAGNFDPDQFFGPTKIFVHDLHTGQTSRVSVASDGTHANSGSIYPVISADGRFVAFVSAASNLVPGDSNNWSDVFVHDRQTGQTSRVSVASDGAQGNAESNTPSISADGSFVAFMSDAANLVPGDTNGWADVFVHDRQTGQTSRVSVASNGAQANGMSWPPSISGDGRFITFMSDATNLVAGDTNDWPDIYVHDRQTGQTSRVSVASNGAQANGFSLVPSISADGRYVVFQSWADNLVPNDTKGRQDVFVHDRQTRQTSRVSVASDGTQGNGDSSGGYISADGRYVVFSSGAYNFFPGDIYGTWDAFVHDRQTGQTSLVSAANGEAGNGDSYVSSISADGRFIAFNSAASNLVSNDVNGYGDVFVYFRGQGE